MIKKLRSTGFVRVAVNIFTPFIFSFAVLALIFIPLTAEASFFSFLIDIFSANDAEAEVISPNSQNMALLQATISPNPDDSSTKNDFAIVGETSLSPEISVFGDAKTLNDDQISLYVVHPGDTLPAIAKMFGVSVNTIRWGNDIVGNDISVGQTLVILPISGVQHIVKSGDTLQSIARQHKGEVNDIMQYNNLTKDSKLALGDIVVVPDGIDSVTPTSTYSNNGSIGPTSSYPVYEGYYMRPIIGGRKTQGIHGHNAVDLTLYYGANIFASAEGQVILSRSGGWNGGYGSYIILQHNNGTQTVYGHLAQNLVSVGDHVIQSQIIGKMGRTGHATGVHLHFEIRGARNPF